jgi:hypothetical protein
MSPDQLASAIQDQLAAYFEHLAARVRRYARALPLDKLWVQPLPFGNSLGHLIVHLTGSLNNYIGAQIAGTGYARDRPGEFADKSGRSIEELLGAFDAAIALVVQTLRSQGPSGLVTAAPQGEPPVENRFGLFLVCAGHISNHVGQMAWLMHAHGLGTDEKVW